MIIIEIIDNNDNDYMEQISILFLGIFFGAPILVHWYLKYTRYPRCLLI